MLRLTAAASIFTLSLAAQPFVTRTIGEIAPPVGEGAAGRVLVVDQQGDETFVIRTRVPYFTASRAELAVTRVAASGTTTTSIAPIDAPNGIFSCDGTVTRDGYLVAWNDGGVHAAFIDRHFHLEAATVLPSYSALPFASASRNVIVRCTASRCLIAWWEYDAASSRIAGSLFDTSGHLLVPRIEFMSSLDRPPFATLFDLAATSSHFMIACWSRSDAGQTLQVVPVDERGHPSALVVLLVSQHPSRVAIADAGEQFVVVRGSPTKAGNTFLAETIDASGGVQQPWHAIASTPDLALYALHLLGHGGQRMLAFESTPEGAILITGATPPTHLNVICLGADLEAIDEVPIAVSTLWQTNDSPKAASTPRGYFLAWNHGATFGFHTYDETSPRFLELPAAGPARVELDARDPSPSAGLTMTSSNARSTKGTPVIPSREDAEGAVGSFDGGRPLVDGPSLSRVVNAAAAGDRYAILRHDLASRADTTGLSVAPAGRSEMRGDPIVVSDRGARNASIASDGNEWLICWADADGFFTRVLHRDGTLAAPVGHGSGTMFGELIWDGAEYATLASGPLYGETIVLRAFDTHGIADWTIGVLYGGRPYSIAGNDRRIAIAWTTNAGTMVSVVDGRSHDVIAETRISSATASDVRLTASSNGFIAFARIDRTISIFELDRDGRLGSPDPFVVPVGANETFVSVAPFGTSHHLLFGLSSGKSYVRILDVAARTATDPIPFPDDGDRVARADPGIAGNVVVLSTRTVRGDEMEGTSTIVRELLQPAVVRRRAF